MDSLKNYEIWHLKLEMSLSKNISTGDAASNEFYYHGECYKQFVRNYNKLVAVKTDENTDHAWIKARFSIMWCCIFIKRWILNQVQFLMLLTYGIDEISHTTRLKDRLLNSVPNVLLLLLLLLHLIKLVQ